MTAPLSHINLLVSTPAGDDSFCGDYIVSLNSSKQQIEHFGGKFAWNRFPDCSDLCHVRNKILGNFLRAKEYTHMLKVDSDISWYANDLIECLLLNKDFIAGVGCKKKLPLEWCAGNSSDEDGHLLDTHIYHEGGTRLADIQHVGAGFVLISRDCAQKMIDSYPELAYVDISDGMIETALYDPVIITNGDYKRRYYDDFAFCHRWRKIGGKVTILPSIHLRHKGSYVYEGKWEETFDHGEKNQN